MPNLQKFGRKTKPWLRSTEMNENQGSIVLLSKPFSKFLRDHIQWRGRKLIKGTHFVNDLPEVTQQLEESQAATHMPGTQITTLMSDTFSPYHKNFPQKKTEEDMRVKPLLSKELSAQKRKSGASLYKNKLSELLNCPPRNRRICGSSSIN